MAAPIPKAPARPALAMFPEAADEVVVAGAEVVPVVLALVVLVQ